MFLPLRVAQWINIKTLCLQTLVNLRNDSISISSADHKTSRKCNHSKGNAQFLQNTNFTFSEILTKQIAFFLN